jgi:hypothetical protein
VHPADEADVPIQTRCPSCGAAVPVAAAWCSLCHTDLRAPRQVSAASTMVLPGVPAPLPGAVAPVTAVADVARAQPGAAAAPGTTVTDHLGAGGGLATATQPAAAPGDGDPATVDDLPLGRHSRERVDAVSAGLAPSPGTSTYPALYAAPAAAAQPGGRAAARRAAAARGRHASGGATRRSASYDASDLPLEIPAAAEATPEQVDAIAEQMLTRLAIDEPRSKLVNPDDLPGGKWGVIVGGMAAVIAGLILLSVVLNFLTNRG